MKEEKKNKSKILKMVIAIVATTICIMLANSTNTYATLQANTTTHGTPTTKKGAEWILEIRAMEATGGTMGLNANYDSNSTTTLMESVSNNIDVHMMKTTEWGAIEILAASGYGAGSSAQVTNTTTTNPTGVYFDGKTWEWTAGISKEYSYDARYYDKYTSGQQSGTSTAGGPKAGDGLGSATLTGSDKYSGCALWPNQDSYRWPSDEGSAFHRGGNGLFSYMAGYQHGLWNSWWDHWQPIFACRGVAVVGQDL